MKKFKNHQRPRRKYRFDILNQKKALKSGETVPLSYSLCCYTVGYKEIKSFFIMYFTRKVIQYRYVSPREETREVRG
jgi:hypothetical protein